MHKFILVSILINLGACSSFGGGDEIVFDKTLGPRTSEQIKSLPDTLSGDHAGAKHTGTKTGPNMTTSDGSGSNN